MKYACMHIHTITEKCIYVLIDWVCVHASCGRVVVDISQLVRLARAAKALFTSVALSTCQPIYTVLSASHLETRQTPTLILLRTTALC